MIVHVDMDSFFVAIERLKDPSLTGKPVVVGGDPSLGRTVVASASYEARTYGIHSATPMAVAVRLCPALVVVPGDFHTYDRYYRQVKEVLKSFSPTVEMTSIDEGYVDLTGTQRLWGSSMEAGERIRWRIKQATGLNCTVGIAKNKVMAKIASNWAKPNGLFYISPGKEREFLASLPVDAIPGVGNKTGSTLRAFGLETVGQITTVDESLMETAFGAYGRSLWRTARGEDDRGLVPEWRRKSISKETTFRVDTADRQYIVAVLHYLIEKVCRRLRQEKKRARTVSVKLRYEDFETELRSMTLSQPENVDEVIFSVARDLTLNAITRRVRIRLIGVGLSNLTDDYHQIDLFEEHTWLRMRQRLLAMDQTRERFGFDALLAGEAIPLINYSGRVTGAQIS
ncbi:MAG: DNA polymerase IV [Candidatus Neomarinimicrobiota bacterium]